MWETRVRFLGGEDPLEKEMAVHSSTLAWKIPWTEEPDRLQSMGSQRVRHDWATLSCPGLPGKSRYDISSFLLLFIYICVLSCSVVSDSLPPHGLYPARLLCPWNFPSRNTGVGYQFLCQWSSQLRNQTCISCVSCIGRWILYPCATYFWLPWVFVAMLGLSLVAESRGYFLMEHRL